MDNLDDFPTWKIIVSILIIAYLFLFAYVEGFFASEKKHKLPIIEGETLRKMMKKKDG